MFCKNCGKELKEGAVFCANCGQRVLQPVFSEQMSQPEVRESAGNDEKAPAPAGKPGSGGKRILWIAAGIMVIAAACAGYFLWAGRSDEIKEDEEETEVLEDAAPEAEEEEPDMSKEEGDGTKEAEEEPQAEPEAEPEAEASEEGLGSMETYFFDCTIHSAYLCSEFETYRPEEGNRLLAAEITVTNTFEKEFDMYDTDFQVQWGGTGEKDFSVPITYDKTEEGMDVLRDDQLPGIYHLEPGESRTGLLVFEIPKNRFDLSISYMEAFDDDTTGETYFINFHLDPPEDQAFLPTSSSAYLTRSDLEGFSQDDCRIARNELYARHGRRFDDPNLQAYFDAFDWYEGTIDAADFDDSVMNEYETANRDLIIQYEKDMGYR